MHIVKDIFVAPLAGAWIEMSDDQWCMNTKDVAPLAGAWIEIDTSAINNPCINRRSPRGSVD